MKTLTPDPTPATETEITPKPLKIIRLEANNIKRLRAVEIVPSGNVVILTGKNDAGKSSTLDAIEYALNGAQSLPPRPLRDGTSKGHIVCDLHDLVVTRKFTAAGGTTLTVTAKDGTPLKSPQAVLDSLCAAIGFDPLSFVRMKPAEQRQQLSRLVGLDQQFAALESERTQLYAERTDASRELARHYGKLTSFQFDPHAPADEVSASNLLQQLEAIQEHNRANDRVKQAWKGAHEQTMRKSEELQETKFDITQIEEHLAKLRSQYAQLLAEFKTLSTDLSDREKQVAAFEYQDEAPVKAAIEAADSTNIQVRSNRRHKEISEEVSVAKNKVESLAGKIEAIDQHKVVLLSQAKFPLPGLSFDETGVLLNGVPFSQGSQARQLQAAVAIGLALNPRVRVILVRDASLLDEDSLKLISDIVTAADAQVWLEVVNSKDPSAVVIEDGRVADSLS